MGPRAGIFTRKRTLYVAIGCLVIILANATRLLHFNGIYSNFDAFRRVAMFASYVACIVLWGATAADLVSRRQIKRMLTASMLLMLFWVLARTLRFYFLLDETSLRLFLWYCYYIPMVLLPLVGLHAAYCMGHSLNWRTPPAFMLLYAVAALLVCGILTNSLHQRAFVFYGVASSITGDYRYGPLYYAAAAWMLLVTLATVVLLLCKARTASSRRRVWQPLAIVVLAVAYGLVYAAGVAVIELTAGLSMAYVLLWESCFASGLVVTNGHQGNLFAQSPIPMRIADASGTVVHASRTASVLDRETPGWRLLTVPIRGGEMRWAEDVSALERMRSELDETRAALREANAMLEAENATRRAAAAAQAKNKLYEHMSTELAQRLAAMDQVVSEAQAGEVDQREALQIICVMGSFIKRRSNLFILGQETGTVEVEEFRLCLLESARALGACGIDTQVAGRVRGWIALEDAKSLYDAFEGAVEATLGICRRYRIDLAESGGALELALLVGERPFRIAEDIATLGLAARPSGGDSLVCIGRVALEVGGAL